MSRDSAENVPNIILYLIRFKMNMWVPNTSMSQFLPQKNIPRYALYNS